GAADVDAVVGDGGGRVERAARPEPLLRARLPEELSGARVQRVDMAVVRAEVDVLPGEREAVLDLVAGLVAPDRSAGGRAQGIDLSGPVSDVHEPVRDDARRLGGPHLHLPAHLARV